MGRILRAEVELLARTLALSVILVIVAAACGGDASESTVVVPPVTGTALMRVSAFGVSALVPDGWVAEPSDQRSYYVGLTASPGPMPGPIAVLDSQGLLATRVDATEVGAPSDLYYLAARGPIIARVTAHTGCSVTAERVFVDHAPTWMAGRSRSPGDFVATASGRCVRHGGTTAWSYFIAVPGYGPARETGIPGSGLYLIVASTPAAPGASRTLAKMIGNVRFGDDSAGDFVHAVRATA